MCGVSSMALRRKFGAAIAAEDAVPHDGGGKSGTGDAGKQRRRFFSSKREMAASEELKTTPGDRLTPSARDSYSRIMRKPGQAQ